MKEPAPEVVVAGKYLLDGQLAEGGMGSVWVAKHVDLGVPVAIKFMGSECAETDEGRTRFEREAKAAALLQSPNVVAVQDYGVDDGLAYMVMELLDGEDLADRIYRRSRLSLEETLMVLQGTAKALRRAQELGIVHRDIKPQNIFLAKSPDGEEETVKVLDFGIAKETGPTFLARGSNTGQIIGSPHFMSPEAVRGARDVDHRSDLWSLAVIVFECITGKMPFDSENVGDVMAKILADPIPLATEVAPDLPPEIDKFFEKALARDRNQRFQSAREMAEAFAEIVHGPGWEFSGAPPSSRPPPVSMRSPHVSARTSQTSEAVASKPAKPAPSGRKGWIWGAAVVLAVAGIALAVTRAVAPGGGADPAAGAAQPDSTAGAAVPPPVDVVPAPAPSGTATVVSTATATADAGPDASGTAKAAQSGPVAPKGGPFAAPKGSSKTPKKNWGF